MHILITGATKGIGLAIAKKFATDRTGPLRLSVCSRHKKDVAEICTHLEGCSDDVQVFGDACDVSSESDVARFVEEAQHRFGVVNVLVNNAGFGIFRTVEEMTTEEFDSVLAVNLRGVYLMTQAVLPRMLNRQSGTIVTISSLAGKNGFSRGSAYCAAKFAVRGLMQSLFLEVRSSNIRVATIFPGSVDTEFFSPGRGTGSMKSDRALKPEDVADCVYLVSTVSSRADISEIDIRPTNPQG